MTRTATTTIRVTTQQRDQLRDLADARATSLSSTFDAALEALRRHDFYRAMADAAAAAPAAEFRDSPNQRDDWLTADIA